MPNQNLDKLDKLLQDAYRLSNDNDALPCIRAFSSEIGREHKDCLSYARAHPGKYPPDVMCPACAIHHHITQATTRLVQLKRFARL